MEYKLKQEGKPKAYQVLLYPADSIPFDQQAKAKGLTGAAYLRMLVKREIENTKDFLSI